MSPPLGYCRCPIPCLRYPGKCVRCQLTHYDISQLRLHFMVILPHQFVEEGKLSRQAQDALIDDVDRIFQSVFDNAVILPREKLLEYFHQRIPFKINALLAQKYRVFATRDDEDAFKYDALGLAISQMKI